MIPQVAVLGGGIAGLAAAWTLAKQGRTRPVLFEAASRVGGVLETVHDAGYLIERAADNFSTIIPDALELTRAAGLEEQLISPNAEGRQAFVLNRGRILPIPAGFSLMQPTRVRSILTTQTLSWRAKARLLNEFWIARRSSNGDESLESFVTRRLGRETFENLVEPIVSGIFTADPKTLSMAATMPQFLEMERRHGGLIRGHLAARKKDAAAAARRASGARYDQFVAPRDGMSSWVEGLAGQLPDGCLHLNTSVRRLSRQTDAAGAGWQVELSDGTVRDFDAVICALPAAATARLLQETEPAAASLIQGISYASSVVVAMVLERHELRGRVDGFGLIIPRKEQREALAISYTSNKYPGRVPEGQILLRIFMGGALRPELNELPDEALLNKATRELREVLGWQGHRPRWQAVIRWDKAMPQYVVGHVDRIRELKALLTQVPTLRLCGAAYDGVGIPQCVRGGRQAADAIVGELTGPRQVSPS